MRILKKFVVLSTTAILKANLLNMEKMNLGINVIQSNHCSTVDEKMKIYKEVVAFSGSFNI